MPKGIKATRETLDSGMQTPTVIEIGPNAANFHRPQIYDPEVLKRWKEMGKSIVRRVYLGKWDKANRLSQTSVSELVHRWALAMTEEHVDGIAIDEFVAGGPVDLVAGVSALKEIRKRFPDKLIFCWIAGKLSPVVYKAIRDYADYAMLEVYHPETAAKGFPIFGFPLFRSAVEYIEKAAPGITQKTMLGIGVHERLYNNDPNIDYGDFIEAQIRTIREDELLGGLPGLAIWAPAHGTLNHVRRLDLAIEKYFYSK